MERRANRHRWTEKDDIVALYFYKFGDLGRTSSLAIVGEVEAWVRAVFECALPTFAPSQAAAGSIMQLCNLALYIDDTPTYRNLSCGNLRVYNGKVVGPAKKGRYKLTEQSSPFNFHHQPCSAPD
jgi:hypothetical protein